MVCCGVCVVLCVVCCLRRRVIELSATFHNFLTPPGRGDFRDLFHRHLVRRSTRSLARVRRSLQPTTAVACSLLMWIGLLGSRSVFTLRSRRLRSSGGVWGQGAYGEVWLRYVPTPRMPSKFLLPVLRRSLVTTTGSAGSWMHETSAGILGTCRHQGCLRSLSALRRSLATTMDSSSLEEDGH